MKEEFWHQKWKLGDIAFHESEVNPFLIEHFEKLNLQKDSRIFLPLCGKTRDITWLLACGYRVVGAELSEIAIKEVFNDLVLVPEISKDGDLIHYRANNIDIFVGDIFAVSADYLGSVSAIYDRAALVALPAEIRENYTSHLINISDAAPQLLITYEYNQKLIGGPPFSVNEEEVKRHYGACYHLKPIETKSVAGGLKGQVAATETVWWLQ